MFSVLCKGKNLSELKKSVEAALAELHGEVRTTGSVAFQTPKDADDDYVDESQISTFNNVTPINSPVVSHTVSETPTGELDSKGMPWDARIHASSRGRVADGSWKYKRGTTDAQIAEIENATRGSLQQSPVRQMEQNYSAPQQNVAPITQQQYIAPVQQQVAPTPTPAPMPQMGSGHTLQTFCANFPMIIGTLVQEGKIDQNYVNTLNAHFGVDQIWKLNDQQKALVFTDFVNWGFVKQVG